MRRTVCCSRYMYKVSSGVFSAHLAPQHSANSNKYSYGVLAVNGEENVTVRRDTMAHNEVTVALNSSVGVVWCDNTSAGECAATKQELNAPCKANAHHRWGIRSLVRLESLAVQQQMDVNRWRTMVSGLQSTSLFRGGTAARSGGFFFSQNSTPFYPSSLISEAKRFICSDNTSCSSSSSISTSSSGFAQFNQINPRGVADTAPALEHVSVVKDGGQQVGQQGPQKNESIAVTPRDRGYYLFSSLRSIPSNDAIDPACYSILTCRGSGPGGQGANSSSSKVEVRVDLDMLGLYLEEVMTSGQAGEIDESPGYGTRQTGVFERVKEQSWGGEEEGDEIDDDGEEDGESQQERFNSPKLSCSDSSTSTFSSSSPSSFSPQRRACDAHDSLRMEDEVISDPEGDLYGLAPHDRIIEKIKTRLPSILRHGGGGGTVGAGSDQSYRTTSATARTVAHTNTIKDGGPMAELACNKSILIITCNQHRSNRQNTSDCLTRLREIIFEASYVMPTETRRNKSYRASYQSVNKAKQKRQAGSNKRRVMAKVRKGLW